MKSALVLVGVVLAACESGLVVEIRPTEGTREVAVFVATGACDREICGDFIVPPGSTEPLDGDFYVRDGASVIMPVESDGAAYVKFEPGEESSFEVLLAIGLSPEDSAPPVRLASSAALLDTNLDVTGPRHIVLELDPVNAAANDSNDPSRPFAGVWTSPRGDDLCAGFQASRDHGGSRTFVLPADNPDCDELPTTQDCDPQSHSSNPTATPPPVEEADCIGLVELPDPTVPPTPTDVCMLQGPDPCIDDACLPTDYCVSLLACEGCRDKGTQTYACLADLDTQSTMIGCTAPFVRNLGHMQSCHDEPQVVSFIQVPSCDAIELARADEFPLEFSSQVEIVDATGTHKLTVVMQAEPDNNQGCLAKVLIKGEVAQTGLQTPRLLARISSWGGPFSGIVIPLLIDITEAPSETCDGPDPVDTPTCTLISATNDSLMRCLRAP